MVITLDNLRAGLRWWDENNWDEDLLNDTYYNIYVVRAGGVTPNWWSATVDRLASRDWSAIRPNKKSDIAARGQSCLKQITDQFNKLRAKSSREPSITHLRWENVANLFALARAIKPGKSPVFASKMCHFLFPKVFIPMDNKATDVFLDYEFWWRGMQDEWCRFKQKANARAIVRSAIASNNPLHALYPLETKIMELSQIGLNHG